MNTSRSKLRHAREITPCSLTHCMFKLTFTSQPKLKKTFVTPMWKIASRHAVHRSNLLACHMWTFHPKRKWNFAHGVCFQITTSMNCLCVTDVRIAEWDLQDMAISRLPATKVLYRFIRRAFCLGEIKMLVFCGTERLSPRMHNIIILGIRGGRCSDLPGLHVMCWLIMLGIYGGEGGLQLTWGMQDVARQLQ